MPKINVTAQRIVAVFLLTLLVQMLNGHQADVDHDANYYLSLAVRIGSDGHGHTNFNLLRFDSPLRGYLFSLILLPLVALEHILRLSPTLLSKAFGCAWAAVLLGGLMPATWQHLTRDYRPISWLNFGLFVVLFLLFWSDILSFTLTDVPALTMMLAGLLSLRKPTWGWWVLAGICLAACINFRPAYVIVLPIVAVVALLLTRKQSVNKRLVLAASAALGMALILLPQLRIHQYQFHRNTPLVVGSREINNTSGKEINDLYLWHLNAGLKYEKYGPTVITEKPNRSQIILDPAGLAVLKEHSNKLFMSTGEYLVFAGTHPAEFAGVYGRHLFSGLDIDSTSPYVLGRERPGAWYYLLNYSLLFWGTALLAYHSRRYGVWAWGLLLAIGAVVGVTLPTIMEVRFTLPLHLLLVAAVAFSLKPAAWSRWRQRFRPTIRYKYWLLAYAVWLLLAFSLHTSMYAVRFWDSPALVI